MTPGAATARSRASPSPRGRSSSLVPYVLCPLVVSFLDTLVLAWSGVFHGLTELAETRAYAWYVAMFLVLNAVLFLVFGLGSILVRVSLTRTPYGSGFLVTSVMATALVLLPILAAVRMSEPMTLNRYETPLFLFHVGVFWFLVFLGATLLLCALWTWLGGRASGAG